jgi:CBS domain-containing protein
MRQLSDIVNTREVLVVPPSCSVKKACAQMRDSGAGAVLIADDTGTLVGIFTDRDAVVKVLAKGRSAAKTKLEDVMTPEPKTLSPATTTIEALRVMWDCGFHHVPVVADGVICGIVSRKDFQACEEDRLEEEREIWEHAR